MFYLQKLSSRADESSCDKSRSIVEFAAPDGSKRRADWKLLLGAIHAGLLPAFAVLEPGGAQHSRVIDRGNNHDEIGTFRGEPHMQCVDLEFTIDDLDSPFFAENRSTPPYPSIDKPTIRVQPHIA